MKTKLKALRCSYGVTGADAVLLLIVCLPMGLVAYYLARMAWLQAQAGAGFGLPLGLMGLPLALLLVALSWQFWNKAQLVYSGGVLSVSYPFRAWRRRHTLRFTEVQLLRFGQDEKLPWLTATPYATTQRVVLTVDIPPARLLAFAQELEALRLPVQVVGELLDADEPATADED